MNEVKSNYYIGTRTLRNRFVTVNGDMLEPRFDLRNHSPDGFEWGYNGSGPSQLALAILANEYGDKVAQEYYIDFREAFVARIVTDKWTLESETLDDIMGKIADLEMDSEEAQYRELNDH